jgi:peptide/nickel transport system permease protein
MTALTPLLRPGAAGTREVAVTDGAWRRLVARTDARIGLGLAGVLVLVALAGPLLTADPDLPAYTQQLQPPGDGHLLGTDGSGRDLLARTVAGARTSLGAALLITVITSVVGLLVGVVAGAAGGVVDVVLARVVDVLLGLPGLVLTLALIGLLGPSFGNLVLAMSLTGWAGMARLARAYARTAAGRPDVVAARMAGAGELRIAVGHVLPGAAAQVVVVATLGVGEVVLALAGLSFLGLGAQPPTAEWGTMLAGARETLGYAPWQIIGPATGLVATVLAATLLGEALRDVTDPGARA